MTASRFFPGIICAEGNLWRDQRRLSTEWLRKMGMTKFGPARSTLEARIVIGVNELVQVWNFVYFPAPPGAANVSLLLLFVEFLCSPSKNGF